MPQPDNKDSYSPFSNEGLTAGKKKAFKVVACLAVVSFLCLLSAIYLRFFKKPIIQTVYYLTVQTPELQTADALIDPQPPQKKQSAANEASKETEDSPLIEQLEKERTTIEQTAEALRELVQNAPETSAVPDISALPESPELQQLQQEKDRIEQAKIEKIEALYQEREGAETQKERKIWPPSKQEKTLISETQVPEKEKTAHKKKEKATPASSTNTKVALVKEPNHDSLLLSDQKNNLPQPDLIQTNLMASLPDFSLIKKSAGQNIIPLHIIEPLPELQEDSRYGKLPVKSKGRTPLSAYAKPVENPPKTPYIAILFSGLGKRENATQAAISTLPDTVSLSFSPYAEKLKTFVADARKTGHETLLDLPMQQGAFPETDPGPLGLVSGLPEQENRKRFHKILGRNVAFIGLSAAANENFSYSGTQMKPFFDEAVERGLIYIDGTDNPRMPLFTNALRPDVHIADEFHRAAIRSRLEQARQIALKKGKAFIRIETVPITLLTTAEWIKSFAPTEQNPTPEITFVPLSYYVSSKKEKE
ncbi:MAG: divergent polysaccharide deacetylase family protein [Alphaproteobacteria bacterium]|nr:divergent polysaccharide deacetylase family protein [Alphaproteobacteria bacterium]